jgi:hypothetical protein
VNTEQRADDALREVATHLQEASALLWWVLERFPLETATANRLAVIQRAVVQATAEMLPIIPVKGELR